VEAGIGVEDSWLIEISRMSVKVPEDDPDIDKVNDCVDS